MQGTLADSEPDIRVNRSEEPFQELNRRVVYLKKVREFRGMGLIQLGGIHVSNLFPSPHRSYHGSRNRLEIDRVFSIPSRTSLRLSRNFSMRSTGSRRTRLTGSTHWNRGQLVHSSRYFQRSPNQTSLFFNSMLASNPVLPIETASAWSCEIAHDVHPTRSAQPSRRFKPDHSDLD